MLRSPITHTTLALALLLSLAPLAHATEAPAATATASPATPGAPATTPLAAAERKAVIAELGRQLQANYVFPDVAARVASTLKKKEASGGYAAATDLEAFAKVLAEDLRREGKDLHFGVRFDPDFRPRPRPEGRRVPDAAEVAEGRAWAASIGYGLGAVQRLPGNIGYLEVTGFPPAELVGEAMTAAMQLVQGSDALILDLRRNSGGHPATVAHLLSHFFPQGDVRHLNSIYNRPENSTRQYWTSDAATVRYTKPVYVLTSKKTFSGGEECAYDLQTQKRATLVGETTGGGANPGELQPIGHGLLAFIPFGRAINPVTGTNWEHVGVKPDIAVAAADAQKVAHATALRALIAEAGDARGQARLEQALAEVEGKQ